MEECRATLTILFDEPFWIGLYERETGGRYSACRIVFGAEPKDYEVEAWLLRHFCEMRFSPSLEAERVDKRRVNPKRMQRLIGAQLQREGVGTKAQQALKLQQEQGKQARKARSREERETEQQRQFELRRQKQKERHRGR